MIEDMNGQGKLHVLNELNQSSCTQEEILKICTNIIGARDEYTQGHSHHVYVIAQAIEQAGNFPVDTQKLAQAALLHDIGKILVSRKILCKEGSLNDLEWHEMRRHPKYGKQLLQGSMFEDIGDWILYHHERMDGKGYYGLRGEDIPIASRIIAVADTFSALRTYRSYRPARSIHETIEVLEKAADTQLDSEVVSVLRSYGEDFLENLECSCGICKRRRDAENSRVLS